MYINAIAEIEQDRKTYVTFEKSARQFETTPPWYPNHHNICVAEEIQTGIEDTTDANEGS